jgi:hypothetical protein
MKPFHKLLVVAFSAAFFIASAQAQNAGTVTSHAFAIGKGAGTTGYTSLLCTSAQLAVGQAAADPICRTITGDVTITAAGVTAIGASKVTNSQIATMAANTTKCNATAGTANPTDCPASTMRTNIGVVIGTNVEAWDADLDCFAGISSTGFVKRTGAGTCSAGSFALADLPTGTQDTILGYFGSTTASALAINNCSNALTYSTSTHAFGCNVTAGTGTVTNVATAGLATGGPITSTGTITVTAAVKSDQNTGSSTSAAVVPAVQQHHDSAAKAWASFTSASTPVVQQSYNVSNVVKNSTGNYTITFSTAFASAVYGCNITLELTTTFSTSAIEAYVTNGSRSTTNVTIQTINYVSGTPTVADPQSVFISCFGRQ